MKEIHEFMMDSSQNSKQLRGAYVARINLREPHLQGVANKINAQIAALKELPAQLPLFSLQGSTIWRNNEEVIHRYPDTAIWRRLNHIFLFYKVVANELKGLDFVYFRYQRTSPFFLWLLCHLKRDNPRMFICVEIPTFPYETESVSLRDKVLSWGDRLCRRYLKHYVDRIVTFSKLQEIFGIPTIKTSNGVNVKSFNALPIPKSAQPFRLLGLANLAFWHGYDRVIAGIAAYKAGGGRRLVVFDVIGEGNELPRLMEAVRCSGLEDEVRFHGVLAGESLTAVMTGAHIGVACIGMHRVDKDTSDLKSREFCARGLPFLSGYIDQDFPRNLPFVHPVPPNDEPIDIAEVLQFYEKLRNSHPDYPSEMHDYAMHHLTWQAKLSSVCKEILAANSNN